MGAGGLGLSAVTIAKAMGVKNVISVDIDDAKLAAAKGMGASAVLNSKTAEKAVAELQKIAGGELKAVVDTVGGEATSALALAAIRKGGRYVLVRSEEHTSELQSLMRNSYAVFCLKKKNK